MNSGFLTSSFQTSVHFFLREMKKRRAENQLNRSGGPRTILRALFTFQKQLEIPFRRSRFFTFRFLKNKAQLNSQRLLSFFFSSTS